MLCFTVLILLLPTCCFSESFSVNRMLTDRIVGGWPARASEYPFILSVEMRNMSIYTQFCGASIIGDSWVLTAAHCVSGVSSLDELCFRAGTTFREIGGEIHNVSEIILHPRSMEGRDYDIAIVKVSKPFHYSEMVHPVRLAHRTPPPGAAAVIVGWGSTNHAGSKPYQLQQVVVNIMEHSVCYERYLSTYSITPRMLCASVPLGGKDACQGDSGGPFLTRGELAGIVSWGGVCGDRYYPGVYTDVAYFRPWITSVTGIL